MEFIKNKKMIRGMAGMLAILLTLSAVMCFTGCGAADDEGGSTAAEGQDSGFLQLDYSDPSLLMCDKEVIEV